MQQPAPPRGDGRLRARAAAESIWPLGAYSLLSLVLFGLPVLSHLGSRIIASDQIDSSQFMWYFGWWPHALLHGLNPFVTHAQFVPQGFNLTWATSMPGPSIVLSPITLAFGPPVAWNVIQLLTPALSAWTAFLLGRHLTARLWPSLVGGYVFGFSAYILSHMTGGPNAGLVAMVPLFVLLVLRRVERSLSPRRFVVTMSAALVAQYLISSEELVTSTLFGALALVLAYAFFADHRPALRDLARLLVAGYLAMIVVVSPFLYYFFFGQHYPPGATAFGASLAAFVLPPSLVAVTHTLGFGSLRGANTQAYLGLPLLVLVGAFAWYEWRVRAARLVLCFLLVAAVASLGAHVSLLGPARLSGEPPESGIPGPWIILAHLPIMRYVTPLRLGVFVALAAALVVAMWLAKGGVTRWALGLLVVASLVPNVGSAAFQTRISDPPLFQSGSYRAYLRPTDHVLTIPAWGPNERWQADTKFAFELADGYLGNPFPPSYTRYPIWSTLTGGPLIPDYAAQLRRFVIAKDVAAIVVDRRDSGPWTTLFGTLGVRPLNVGGVLLYRLKYPSRG